MAEQKNKTAKVAAGRKAAVAEEVGRIFAVKCPLFLRECASRESESLAVLPEGDRVELAGEFTADGWARVYTVYGEGYCMTAFLEEVT